MGSSLVTLLVSLAAIIAIIGLARARARALGLVALAIVVFFGTACRTTQPPLAVEDLEVGMSPEAVSALLGEPDWAQRVARPESERSPATSSQQGDAYTEVPEAETWVYSDHLVRRSDVASFSVLSVVLLGMPLILEGIASSFDDETPPSWATQRTSWLHFENDRLTGWSFDYEERVFGEEWRAPGDEMVYDPEIDAYRVVECGRNVQDDGLHAEHCAHYYAENTFYRYDEDGWCTSPHARGPWTPVGVDALPYTLWQHELAVTQPILNACEVTIESIEAETQVEIASLEKAEQEAIDRADSDSRSDPEQKALAIQEAKTKTRAEVAGVLDAEKAAIQAAWKEANGEIAAMQKLRALALKAEKPSTFAKIETARKARKVSIQEAEKVAIRAANEESETKITAIREVEKATITKARTEPDAVKQKAVIEAAKAEAHGKIKAIRASEMTAIAAAKQEAQAKLTAIKSPQATSGGGGQGGHWYPSGGGFGSPSGGFGGFEGGGGVKSSGGGQSVGSAKGGGGYKTKPSK